MIDMRTPIPGPRAREAIARDRGVVSQSYTRAASMPLVAERGEGVWIWDVDGNRLLDFAAGIAVCSTGHCHPAIVRAIDEQAHKLIHLSGTDFYYMPQIDLAEKIVELVPGHFKKRVFFANSGTEAVEAAIKLARYKTRRQYLVAFHGAFHGRTMGSLALSASKVTQRRRFGPLMPGVVHAPYPYCYRCPEGREPATCNEKCLDNLTDTIFSRLAPPDEIAAVFIEPIQGEGGYVPAPAAFLRKLRTITQEHGILLVVDEIQSGAGRTGKMFACEWAGIEPDIVCMAKGIASGMPLGLIVYRSDETDWGPGAHASTFGGNPIACAVALKTIDLLQGGLIDNVRQVGDYLLARLGEMQRQYACIGDVRGRGLMVGAEIVRDAAGKEKSPKMRDAILNACFQRGLVLIGCGENTIRFAPPLVISMDEMREGLDVFAEALRGVQAGETVAG